MKCVHCSAWVEPEAWFCPDCKRTRPPRPARNAENRMAAVAAGMMALTLLMLAARGVRWRAASPPAAIAHTAIPAPAPAAGVVLTSGTGSH